MSGEQALLIGGPFDGRKVSLTRTPPRIEAAGVTYDRLDDPDTGEYLGGYVFAPASHQTGDGGAT